MHQRRTTIKKSFSYGSNLKIERSYEKIKAKELAELMGTDRQDINDAIASNTEATSGMFIPKPGSYNNGYISAIISGEKPVFYNKEIDPVEPPKIDECSFHFIRPEVYKYTDVLKFFPERFHRKGPNKGRIILDDLKFTSTIFAKVRPTEYREWVLRQKDLNSTRLSKDSLEYIMIDTLLLDKIRQNAKTIHKKGKSGKIIQNFKHKLDIKRKRMEQERAQMQEEDLQDKIYFPPADLAEREDVPEGKRFVGVQEYNTLKEQALTWNSSLFEISAHAQSIPWKTTRHFPDPAQEEYQYNMARDEVIKQYAKFHIVIPTLEEARVRYAANN